MKDEKYLVPICRDHFLRLATNSTCDFCPSKLVNENVVKKMAELYNQDKDAGLSAIMHEIYSIRQSQQALSNDVESFSKLEKDITRLSVLLIGVDGKNGLRSKIETEIEQRRELSKDVQDIRKEIEAAKRLIYTGVGIVATISVVIPIIIKYIN